MATLTVDVLSYTDYDIWNYVWTCPRCNNKVAQDVHSSKNVLRCCKCTTELRVVSRRGTDRSEHMCPIYEYEVVVERAPTREDLLMERDEFAEELERKMMWARDEALAALHCFEPATKDIQTLVRVAKEYDKMMAAYKTYLENV